VIRPTIEIRSAESPADIDAVRALFLEYIHMPGWEAGFSRYLEQQDFGSELAQLPGAYAAPEGALLLARVDGRAAGCIAFKPLVSPDSCEMKRLFVRPEFRSLGIGEQLVRRLLADARAAGYRRMRLDTLPSMSGAQRLYERLGFRDIAAYCDNPISGARFLECELETVGSDPG
jgi:ribosomal protein S18 acetylase RimI-like enzyme